MPLERLPAAFSLSSTTSANIDEMAMFAEILACENRHTSAS